MASESYQIKLPQFEGPFDLLLFFIERDELDIYNIPIHSITKDFLEFIQESEALNIEVASEFILFASTLMRIKSKMLLPRREMDAAGNEIDPRAELVDKILEYKRFKEAAASFSLLEAERLLHEKRGNALQELAELGQEYAEGTEYQSVTLYKLMNAFERAMKKYKDRLEKPQHVVVKYNYTLESQRDYLVDRISRHGKERFEALFETFENRVHAIFTFLALLELAQQKIIYILSGEGINQFYLEWKGTPEFAAGESQTGDTSGGRPGPIGGATDASDESAPDDTIKTE